MIRRMAGVLFSGWVLLTAYGAGVWPESVTVSERDGALQTAPWSSGEFGLWRIGFIDGSHLDAAAFAPEGERRFTLRQEGETRILAYSAPEAEVTVTLTPVPAGIELRARLTPHGKTVLDFDLPARLRFDPERVDRLVFPQDGNMGLGVALNHLFLRAGNRMEVPYPPAFSDFFHLTDRSGAASAVYGVRPRPPHEPWRPKAIFVPGRLACGGDAKGGYCEHRFGTYVKPNETWEAPAVCLTVALDYPTALREYAAANGLTRPLADKVKPEMLARLRQAPLLKLGGPCREKTAILDQLPVPTLLHFADYLMGGFDKQLPDHLPPNPSFGTGEELDAFFAAARASGHLLSPYTNPTWWCDEPKGPTFAAAGEAPLLKAIRTNAPNPERYAQNGGWTTTLWHPAVQAANRKVVRQFTKEHPVDLLFQDQCGARTWLYDLNPASPTPYAYAEGMLAMNEEDSRIVPLATESGWDHVANLQTMLCGMTWSIVPTPNPPAWRQPLKRRFAPESWTIEPLTLRLMHDKVLLTHHDLGQFVRDERSLVWTLALGYGMSDDLSPGAWRKNGADREWFAWLARIQKSVCSRYAGTPLRSFTHDRTPLFAREEKPREIWDDDGVIRAVYGDVALLANLGEIPRTVDGHLLAPYGYWVEAPGLLAAHLEGTPPFICEGNRMWTFARQSCTVRLPTPFGVIERSLPARDGVIRIEPTGEEARQIPAERPGERPFIAVLDLGSGVGPEWSPLPPAAWIETLNRSPLVERYGIGIRRIGSGGELIAAMNQGHTRCFAVLNPYGELFPVVGGGTWRGMLEEIARYVSAGGIWWETGGYSFYTAVWREGDVVRREAVHTAGMETLGLSVGGGAVEQAPEPLVPTRTGRRWLTEADLALLKGRASAVNRGTESRPDALALTLLEGEETRQAFVGGYRLNGWGTLWRLGGMHPDPQVARTVVTATLLHHFTHAPEPVPPSGIRYVWESTVR